MNALPLCADIKTFTKFSNGQAVSFQMPIDFVHHFGMDQILRVTPGALPWQLETRPHSVDHRPSNQRADGVRPQSENGEVSRKKVVRNASSLQFPANNVMIYFDGSVALKALLSTSFKAQRR